MPEMTKSWQNGKFYAPDLLTRVDVADMPPFRNSLPLELKSWRPETNLAEETRLLVQEIYRLQDSGLGGM